MLRLSADLLRQVVDRCRVHHPHEACGILAGPAGQPPGEVVAGRHIPLANVAEEPGQAFALDPTEQLSTYAEMDVRGEDPVVLYHSHPQGDAAPSPRDVAAGAGGACIWLIVSLRRPEPEVRAWRIVDGRPLEEHIRVVDGEHRPDPTAHCRH